MRFRSRGKSGGETLVRSQRRMTLLVVGIGLVVLFVSSTGKSSFFSDLFSNAPVKIPQPPAVSQSLLATDTLRADEFRVVPTEANGIASQYSSLLDREGIADMESGVQTDVTGVPVIPQVLTRTIRDDVLGVLSSGHSLVRKVHIRHFSACMDIRNSTSHREAGHVLPLRCQSCRDL